MSGPPPVSVVLLNDGVANALRITIERPTVPALTSAQEAAWKRMCDANLRLHDGPILSVRASDLNSGMIACVVDSYARLAVQRDPSVGDLGVRLLGVKAMLVGRDADGVERVLLARRGSQTLAYPGMWEMGPAGGVEVPAPSVNALSSVDLIATVVREGREELGMEIAPRSAGVVAIVFDGIAHSVDAIVAAVRPGMVDSRAGACGDSCGWEYVDVSWLSREELIAFSVKSPGAISPPTSAALEALGWV